MTLRPVQYFHISASNGQPNILKRLTINNTNAILQIIRPPGGLAPAWNASANALNHKARTPRRCLCGDARSFGYNENGGRERPPFSLILHEYFFIIIICVRSCL